MSGLHALAASPIVTGVVAWLLTYAIHSTILILAVWLIVRGIRPLARRVSPRLENRAWKLALVGALQANAPLRGPIVMDSPFGRLDEGHTENVVAALPTMADQVVLLVHEAELRRNNVRRILGSKLLREYELVKVSARRTRIDAVR